MRWIWPDIQHIDDAKSAAYNGAGMAFFVSVVTAVVTYLHISGIFRIFENFSASAFVDAAVFAIVGAGLLWKSRTIAVIAVMFYGVEQYFMIKEHGSRMSVMAIIVMLSFINAVRGTFAYHNMKKVPVEEKEVTPPSVVVQETGAAPKAPRKKFALLLISLVLLLFGTGLFFLIPVLKKQNFDAGGAVTQAFSGSKFKLDGILKDPESPIAVINGNFLKEGDTYENHTVKEIGPGYIVLDPADGGKSLRIDLYPDAG